MLLDIVIVGNNCSVLVFLIVPMRVIVIVNRRGKIKDGILEEVVDFVGIRRT